MKIKFSSLLIAAVLANVSACTYVKNLFPDKEKDYQFITEIPPLILPPDLAGASITRPSAAPVDETTGDAPSARRTETIAAAAVQAAEVDDDNEEVAPYTPAPETEAAPAINRELIQLELVDADEGNKRLRIDAPLTMAWRMVGKALSRNSIEVTKRNQDERLFHIHYDPNAQTVQDGSVFDEISFFFSGLAITEQEYVLHLVSIGAQQAEVIVLDKEQKPVSNKASLSLLTLLHDTIKADLAK
ncbi:MAG: outer membrane protein assembly factor BamC [Methylobacter sp.]